MHDLIWPTPQTAGGKGGEEKGDNVLKTEKASLWGSAPAPRWGSTVGAEQMSLVCLSVGLSFADIQIKEASRPGGLMLPVLRHFL